jgi:hypothetical protein
MYKALIFKTHTHTHTHTYTHTRTQRERKLVLCVVVAHACSPSTLDTNKGRWQVSGQPGLHSEILLQTTVTTITIHIETWHVFLITAINHLTTERESNFQYFATNISLKLGMLTMMLSRLLSANCGSPAWSSGRFPSTQCAESQLWKPESQLLMGDTGRRVVFVLGAAAFSWEAWKLLSLQFLEVTNLQIQKKFEPGDPERDFIMSTSTWARTLVHRCFLWCWLHFWYRVPDNLKCSYSLCPI